MPSASARRSAAARFSTGFTTTFPEAFYFTGGIDEIRACSACPALAPERALLALPPHVRMEHSRLDRPQSSAASRNSRTFAARSRVVQYQWSSGCLVFVSTSKTCGNREQWWHAWARAVGYVNQRALQERPGGFGGSRTLSRSVTPFAPEALRPRLRWHGMHERRDPVVAPPALRKRQSLGYWQRAAANGLAGGAPSWKVNASMFTWLSTVVTVLVVPASMVVLSPSWNVRLATSDPTTQKMSALRASSILSPPRPGGHPCGRGPAIVPGVIMKAPAGVSMHVTGRPFFFFCWAPAGDGATSETTSKPMRAATAYACFIFQPSYTHAGTSMASRWSTLKRCQGHASRTLLLTLLSGLALIRLGGGSTRL